MTRSGIAGGAAAIVLVACSSCDRALEFSGGPAVVSSTAATPIAPPQRDFLYGRITTTAGATYEGRLRWGGDQEALWGNYFNGFKDENPWVAHAPPEQLPAEHNSTRIFGIEVGWQGRRNLGRPFMARFGDITRIEPRGRDIHVTLKSGTAFDLDRYAADDLADGVRVWDKTAGVVDIGEWHISTIELFSPPAAGADTHALHGTVRTARGDFAGLIQWSREECVGTDELAGHTADGAIRLRFDGIRSIARRSHESADVLLLNGRTIVLSDMRNGGQSSRGIYVDDPRYGRVLVSWNAFERVDFSPAEAGPAYTDFSSGRPVTGSVVTRSGHRIAGRLVYDLDESETTETLDAPAEGVDYTIPFGLIASIALSGAEPGAQGARVTLHSGEKLQLDRAGDLGDGHAGMLIFAGEGQRPEYVSWTDVAQIDFDRPVEMYPPGRTREK